MRIGSLCSGYGGLDAAVQSVLGGSVAWVSDIDAGANKILAHRYAGVPNLGDFTTTDWARVGPVDVLTAGFPCQPVSHAGRRLGDEDERWLWDDVARAVGELRPGLVVLENVRGLLTAGAGRLFGRVLGSLADLGYDARWHGLRAADIGAPHGRFRIFIVAQPQGQRHDWGERAQGGWAVPADRDRGTVTLPTPTARDWKNVGDPDKTAARMAERGQPLGEVVVNGLTPGSWGRYEAAIHRWEWVLARYAPRPTEVGPKGNTRLSARFVEWMMGLPPGWVTDVPGITRNEALRALGNGVVPQQCAAALRLMLGQAVAA